MITLPTNTAAATIMSIPRRRSSGRRESRSPNSSSRTAAIIASAKDRDAIVDKMELSFTKI